MQIYGLEVEITESPLQFSPLPGSKSLACERSTLKLFRTSCASRCAVGHFRPVPKKSNCVENVIIKYDIGMILEGGETKRYFLFEESANLLKVLK